MMQWADVSEAELAEKLEISYNIWRNAVVEISLLCPGASDFMENPYPHFVWGKGCSDLHGNHKSLCGKEQRRADRYAGRRALVSYKGADAISGSLDKE